jgi:class 3 adenylate cyclase/tetratricopeptide (TPR) repeat protein
VAATRRLAAIMFTDIVGFSTLSHQDEAGALAMLEEHRRIIRPVLTQFGGREVKTMGDGFLVEFASALQAVRCAEEIQKRLRERNEARRETPRIQLRIGIHVGDVVASENDVYGDAVNVASRIQPFSGPEGICVSRQVYDQVRNHLRLAITSLGLRELKNIAEPVELFRVVLPWQSGEVFWGSSTSPPSPLVPSPSGGSPPVLPPSSSIPFVDRDREKETLDKVLLGVREGKGGTWLLEGAAGIGKTRLARWVGSEAERWGFQVRWGRCSKEVLSPFFPWQQVFRGRTFGEAPDLPSGTESLATSIDTTRPPALVFLDYLERLETEALRRPQFIVIDDLHWADPSSISAFQFLARNLRTLPVLLLATIRPDEVRTDEQAGESNLAEVNEQMDREGIVVHLKLGQFGEAETLQLVQGLLNATLDVSGREADFRTFVERGEGNPYLVLSMTRMLVEEGWLRAGDERVQLAVPQGEDLPALLPESVRGAVQRRLARLSPEERHLLELGAVQGREFELRVMAEVLGLTLPEVNRMAHDLETVHRFLQPIPGRRGRVAFEHALTWEAVLAEQGDGARQDRAGLLGAWWSEHRPEQVGDVARLYHEAGDAERGLPWVERALAESLDHHAPRVAARLARWRLEMQEATGVTVEARARDGLRTVQALRWLDRGANLRLIEVLSALHLPVRLRWDVSLAGVSSACAIDVRRARTGLTEVLKEMNDRPGEIDDNLVFQAKVMEAQVLGREGRTREACSAAAAALALPVASPERDNFYGVLALWASTSALLGNLQGVSERVKTGLEAARRAGLVREEAFLLHSLADLQGMSGDLRAAVRSQERSASIWRQSGDWANLSMALANKCAILIALEEWPPATQAAVELGKLARIFGNLYGHISSLECLGEIQAGQGRWEQSLPIVQECLASARQQGFEEVIQVQAPLLAEALGHLGRQEEAWAMLSEAGKHMAGAVVDNRVRFHRARGELFTWEGDLTNARKELEESLGLVMEGMLSTESIHSWRALADLESRCGNADAAANAWKEMNAARQRVGLASKPLDVTMLGTSGAGKAV